MKRNSVTFVMDLLLQAAGLTSAFGVGWLIAGFIISQ